MRCLARGVIQMSTSDWVIGGALCVIALVALVGGSFGRRGK